VTLQPAKNNQEKSGSKNKPITRGGTTRGKIGWKGEKRGRKNHATDKVEQRKGGDRKRAGWKNVNEKAKHKRRKREKMQKPESPVRDRAPKLERSIGVGNSGKKRKMMGVTPKKWGTGGRRSRWEGGGGEKRGVGGRGPLGGRQELGREIPEKWEKVVDVSP